MNETIKTTYIAKLSEFLSPREVQKLVTRIERITHKISPINTTTGNTQTIFRWELPTSSPHYATEQDCDKIFEHLCDTLITNAESGNSNASMVTLDDIKQSLQVSSRLGSLELPITYDSFEVSPIHSVDNVDWFKPSPNRYVLEQWLGDKTIITKIQVKAFLTDRRQTGEYQTNREVRWETHPRSPQFAVRKDCLEISDKLIAQIATFNNAPEPPAEVISVIEEVLGEPFVKNSFRCPISGKPVIYADFVARVTAPVHGRSGYQVGHLNPLASTGGHNADNISWITDLGNRVQGEQSLDDIVNEIFYMATFHKKRLGTEWSDVEKSFS